VNTTENSTPGVDFEALATWMSARGLGSGPITEVEPIQGGTQNILLRFVRDGFTYVLRRPPIHKRKNNDETMRRESRVLAALRDTGVPHPTLLAAEPDTSVLGAAFYLMEPVEGIAPLPMPTWMTNNREAQRRFGESMIASLAALGRVDHSAVGLENFGKTDGWLERQVERWRSQLDSYNELENYPGPQLPYFQEVMKWLETNQPTTWQPGIIHGDYHFNNIMLRHDSPEIAAIVDWELCTIGDPLLDLGHLLANWPDPKLPERRGVPNAPGMPSRLEVVEQYAAMSGRDTSDYVWFAVLACYRLAILLEGSNARAHAGLASREIGDRLGLRARQLMEQAFILITNP